MHPVLNKIKYKSWTTKHKTYEIIYTDFKENAKLIKSPRKSNFIPLKIFVF